ncbi:hypothetical protein K443DRAFT_677726 [Laccaria amethystina LaAM-08-1]|uniref:Uncharacterized protein n=1 Tax=Laccaria amethystina LaAM-08-1 TaxID=1095629 RepID=A0A0C9Y2N2_9AGAR|nr:hypothetical protein K443DRAFT_677726 [Laccaria amethystina LaAM-08-1]
MGGHARGKRLSLAFRNYQKALLIFGRPGQLSRKLCGRVLKYLSKLYKSHIDIDNERQRKL